MRKSVATPPSVHLRLKKSLFCWTSRPLPFQTCLDVWCFTPYKSPLLSFVPELDNGLQILTCTSFPSPVLKFEWWVSSLSGCSLPRRRSPLLLLLLLVLSPPPPVAPTTASPFVIFQRFCDILWHTLYCEWYLWHFLLKQLSFAWHVTSLLFHGFDNTTFSFWWRLIRFIFCFAWCYPAEYQLLLRSSFFGGEELLVLEVCSIKLACSQSERFWAFHFILVEPED